MFKEYGRIYIALDADAGGESGVSDMLKTLRDRLPLFRVRFPDGKTDPKQCTREEAWTSLETAKRIS
jgi:DNA primase